MTNVERHNAIVAGIAAKKKAEQLERQLDRQRLERNQQIFGGLFTVAFVGLMLVLVAVTGGGRVGHRSSVMKTITTGRIGSLTAHHG